MRQFEKLTTKLTVLSRCAGMLQNVYKYFMCYVVVGPNEKSCLKSMTSKVKRIANQDLHEVFWNGVSLGYSPDPKEDIAYMGRVFCV